MDNRGRRVLAGAAAQAAGTLGGRPRDTLTRRSAAERVVRMGLKAGPGVLRPWRPADADELPGRPTTRRIWVNMRVIKDGKVLGQWMYALLRRELGGEGQDAGEGSR